MLWAWLLPVTVVRLHDGDLHSVGWCEGPLALVTPVKAIRVGAGLKKTMNLYFKYLRIPKKLYCLTEWGEVDGGCLLICYKIHFLDKEMEKGFLCVLHTNTLDSCPCRNFQLKQFPVSVATQNVLLLLSLVSICLSLTLFLSLFLSS